MKRQFTINDVVMLPRMKARELLAIARALVLNAHNLGNLERPVTEALHDVDAQHKALSEEMNGGEKKAPAQLKQADIAECNAVSALVDFASTWARLPEATYPAQVATGRDCADVFREDGKLEFLKCKPIVKHSEVQRRIESLHARGLDEKIRELGGGPFLDHLARTHETYGAAVMNATGDSEEETPAIRERATELAEAVKSYVIRVVATVDRKRPETQTRANTLLAALRAWESSSNTGATSEEEEPQPAPSPDVTQRSPAPANDAAPVRKVG